jgi:hypothetical protein
MTATTLKILACLFMLVDHIGYILFPEIALLRIIGRLAFPIFAWLLVQGFYYTRDWRLYGLRLVILAVISQPVYQIVTGQSNLNIAFTLTLGLLLLKLASINHYWQLFVYTAVVLLLPVSGFLPIEYGAYGLLVILILALQAPLPFYIAGWLILHVIAMQIGWNLQFFAAFALLLIFAHNNQRGFKLPKYWFYAFYPTHLLVLGIVEYWLVSGFNP